MRMREIIEAKSDNTRRLGHVIGASVKADRALPDTAGDAVTKFVGGEPEAYKTDYWGGIMAERQLEDAFAAHPSMRGQQVRAELEHAFSPVRHTLRQRFGDTITLYRGQREIGDKQRNVLSWSADKRVAALFANQSRHKPITDAEINAAVGRYERTGFLKFRGHYYVRNKEYPEYYNIYDDNRQNITDGDDLRDDLKSRQRDIQQMIDDPSYPIIKAEVPIENIVWITNRFNQREFIVLNQGASYVGK